MLIRALFVFAILASANACSTNSRSCSRIFQNETHANAILNEWRLLVASRIKQAMTAQKPRITQKNLAELLTGSTENQPYISQILNGKRDFSSKSAKKIAQILNVDVEWLIAADFFEPYLKIDTISDGELPRRHPLRRALERVASLTKIESSQPSIDRFTIEELVDAIERRGWKVILERD